MANLELAARLDRALKTAGLAITGVSIGDEADRATWRVYPASFQAVAQPLIDAFTLPTAAQLADDEAQREIADKKLQAMALALWECIPAPLLTRAQMRARAVALWKTL